MLGVSAREFWVYPIGLFHDIIAARQIMDGAEERPARNRQSKVNYDDDSIFLLE